jgi:hypothetical protein
LRPHRCGRQVASKRYGLCLTPTWIKNEKEAAERHEFLGWQHDAANDAIRNGDHVINLANIHLEYTAASRLNRRTLLQKYFSMLQTPLVSKLWSLAQTKIYPPLRSRYDHGPSISQVHTETLTKWGLSLDAAIDRAMANLRALPAPRWHACRERPL